MDSSPPPDHRPWLPALLRDMADQFDLATAMVFANRFGGRYLHLPARATTDHPVARALGANGERVLAWLIDRHDRLARIVPPRGPQDDNAQLLRLVAAMKARVPPATTNEIAEATGLHVRRVERIVARLRQAEAARQPGLFDALPAASPVLSTRRRLSA